MKNTARLSDRSKGIIFLILSAFCFAMMAMFVRLAGDLPATEKGIARNLISIFIAGAIVLKKGKKPYMPTAKGRWFLLGRSVFGTLGLLGNYYALSAVNLADATMLNKVSPFFTLIFSWLLLKDKIAPRRLLIIVGVFAGCLLVIKPTGQNLLLGPLLIALLGGISAGAAYTCLRGATTNGVDKSFVVFAFSVCSTVMLLPFAVARFVMPTGLQWLYLVGCAVFGCGGQLTITQAYGYAPASQISGYDYTQVLFSAILGFFVFGQLPDVWSFVGYAVIIGLGLLDFCLRKKD